MKKLLLVVVVCFGLSACKGDEPEPDQEEEWPFTLSLGVSSESKSVPNATVTLYTSKEDAIAKVNSITSKITDSEGTVEFKLPQGKTYYWFAEKGCKTNILTIGYCYAKAEGIYVSGNATLEGTGTVNFTNTSSTAYRVEVDRGAFRSFNFVVEAGKTHKIENFLSGNHTMTVAEPNKNIAWDGQSRSFTSECGGTTTIKIPY